MAKLEILFDTKYKGINYNCDRCDYIAKSDSEISDHMRKHQLEKELENLSLEIIYLKHRVDETTTKLQKI